MTISDKIKKLPEDIVVGFLFAATTTFVSLFILPILPSTAVLVALVIGVVLLIITGKKIYKLMREMDAREYVVKMSTKGSNCKENRGWVSYVSKILSASEALRNFLDEVAQTPPLQVIQESAQDYDLKSFLRADALACFERLGYSIRNLRNPEGVGLAILIYTLDTDDFSNLKRLSYDRENAMGLALRLSEIFLNNNTRVPYEALDDPATSLLFVSLFKSVDQLWPEYNFVQRYSVLLYRWASLVAKADGVVTDQERQVLESIMHIAEPSTDSGMNHSEIDVHASDVGNAVNAVRGFQKATHSPSVELMPEDGGVGYMPLESLLGSLDDLIGLEPVKKEVHDLVNYIQIVQRRKETGLKTAPISYHCVFTGNPGTGKTTVARILAGIYRALGVIKKGHLVETDRSGMVAEYLGQTAVKTNKLIDKALDGVLFIDEAYSLIARDGPQDPYGREAVDTLLRRMENDRDRLVVIVAGYPDEMKLFIDSNPGLQSRFNRYIRFPDYSAEELARIFLLLAEKSQYDCNEEVRNSLAQIMEYAISQNDENFGNGRYVRNLFEKAIQRQAVRLSGVAPLTSEMLSELTLHDLGFAYED